MSATLRKPQPKCIEPLVRNEFKTPSGIRFSVSCFRGSEWSLRNMYEPQDAHRHAGFALQLANAYHTVGAVDVFAPTPIPPEGKVALKSDLRTRIDLPHGISMYRNKEFCADGGFLTQYGDAGTFSAGGCGIVMASHGNDLIFAHAGRESILDRQWVKTKGAERSRPYDLADNVLAHLGTRDMSSVHVWPLYFIGPNEFVHRKDDKDPDHAEYNCAAMECLPRTFPGEFGWVDEGGIGIDLARIFRAQCVERGVLAQNVHLDHADLNRELPTTRNGGGTTGRYLVVAVRHS